MNGEPKTVLRGRRTRAEVQQLVSEFPAAGMRQNAFCRSRGLSLSTLARHLKKRRWKRKRKNSRAEYKLLGVELAAEKSLKREKSTTGLALVLSGGCRIEVQRDVDVLTFERFRVRTGRDGICTP